MLHMATGQHDVDAVDLQDQPAVQDEPARRCELGPVEVGTALEELGQASRLTWLGSA
jgi:hypothetical protein